MPITTIALLTIREAQRRRILWVALVMGAAFLAIYGIGLFYIWREFAEMGAEFEEFAEAPANFLALAGLYVVNFLVVIMSVLISVSSISNEVESRLIDTLVTKPIRRSEIVLGKWLGFALMCIIYTTIMAAGVLIISRAITGFGMQNALTGIALLSLNSLVMLSLSIAGGTRFSTLANGVMAFMLYGIAFIGGWVETIGATFRNEVAVNVGIIASLINPIEALWRKASLAFQPDILSNVQFGGPFTVTSEPSDAMILYAIIYIVALIGLALFSFNRKDL